MWNSIVNLNISFTFENEWEGEYYRYYEVALPLIDNFIRISAFLSGNII